MNDDDFNKVLSGLKEVRGIVAGETEAAEVHVPPAIDTRAMRATMGLSQAAFAERFGFSPGAVRDWEQGRKSPDRANRVLLAIVARRPEVVEEALHAA